MPAATCPTRDDIRSYAVGGLPDDVSDSMAEHLDSCADCQATLATIDDGEDTLVGRLRSPEAPDPYGEESQCLAALIRARGDEAALAHLDRPRSAERSASMLGKTLGEYQLLEVLGRGGMGTVYKALHTKLDRVVALKVLPAGRMADDRAVARFEREMKAVGSLDHENIVRAFDAREIDGVPVLIMECVHGMDLGQVARRLRRLPIADACELVRQAAVALQYAHENGLIHRDVKPSNLMLTPEGQVKLLDLGLARWCLEGVDGEEKVGPEQVGADIDEMTGTNQAMGTADYMAPEQTSDSRSVDIRADIYSLGCTLYRLIAGRAPFAGSKHRGTFEKMTAHVGEPVPPITDHVGDVPDELVAVLDRMLAKAPAERFGIPSDVAEALAPLCEDADLPALAARAEEAELPPDTDTEAVATLRSRDGLAPPTPATSSSWFGGRFVWKCLALFGPLGFGIALGIIIMITQNGKTTKVDVPPGANVKVGAGGQVDVNLDGTQGEGANGGTTPIAAVQRTDIQRLQGLWKIVAMRFGEIGDYPPERMKWYDDIRFEVNGYSLQMSKPGQEFKADRFVLVGGREPREIDFFGGELFCGSVGIYKIEGDRWTVRGTRKPDLRPRSFEGALRPDQGEYVFERIEPANPPTTAPNQQAANLPTDHEAILGTWDVVQVVHSAAGNYGGALLLPFSENDQFPSAKKLAETTKVVITRDGFKVLGDLVADKNFEYQINPEASPKIIDFRSDNPLHTENALGVYDLKGNQLRICVSIDSVKGRPEAVWAEYGAEKEMLVLRRAGDSRIEPDEQAIQGNWEVVNASLKIRDMSNDGLGMGGGMPTPRFVAPYGHLAPGRRVAITRHGLVIKGQRGAPSTTLLPGGDTINIRYVQPLADDHTVPYALSPIKDTQRGSIELGIGPRSGESSCTGLYRLQDDRLTIRLGKGNNRPKDLDAPAADDEVLLELRRLSDEEAAKPQKPITPEELKAALAADPGAEDSGDMGMETPGTSGMMGGMDPGFSGVGMGNSDPGFAGTAKDPFGTPPMTDRQRLPGLWKIVDVHLGEGLLDGMSQDGMSREKAADEFSKQLADARFRVQHDATNGLDAMEFTFETLHPRFEMSQGKIKLEPALQPPTADFTECGIINDGFAIYKLEANRWTVRLAEKRETRPRDFDEEPGKEEIEFVFERVEPETPTRPTEPEGDGTASMMGMGVSEADMMGVDASEPLPQSVPAVPDQEAILGTWDVVEVINTPQGALLEYLRTEGQDLPSNEEVAKTTKVVISRDGFKVLGDHVADVNFEYQINPETSPKIIDFRGPDYALGVYDLKGDQLRICARTPERDSKERPAQLWAEFGSDKEMLVLRRTGEVPVDPGAEAIQGDWEVVSASLGITEMHRPDSTFPRYAVPYGNLAPGRRVVIDQRKLRIIGQPGAPTWSDCEWRGGNKRTWQPLASDEAFPYAVNTTSVEDKGGYGGTIGLSNLDVSFVQACQGSYTLGDDRLTIRLGKGATELKSLNLDSPDTKGEVFLELRRLTKAEAAKPQKPMPPEELEALLASERIEVDLAPDGTAWVGDTEYDVDALIELAREKAATAFGFYVQVRCAETRTNRLQDTELRVFDALRRADLKYLSHDITERFQKKAQLDFRIGAVRATDKTPGLSNEQVEAYGELLHLGGTQPQQDASPQGPQGYFDRALNESGPFTGGKEKVDQLRVAKQQELSVIISTMDGIERASVIVDIPSDGTSPRKPTASVTVKTTEGATLNGQHFLAIQNLVSSAFPKLRIGGIFTNLQPRDVTVTDVSKAYTWSDEAASPSERRLNEAKRACEATLEERCRKACAHVPGIELAFGVTATERPMVEGMELGKNDMYARFTLDDKEHVVCLRITGVEASLGVPESYAGQVWNERNPVEQGKEPSTPKKADLAKIAEEEMILVEEAIVSLIPEGITRLDVSARIVPESPDLDASTTDYAWFETDLEPQEGRIIVALNGRNHVLLSTKPEDMMLADDKGERQWALDDISVGKDHGGRPSIKFKFDKAGAKRFGELTGSHLPNGEHAYPLAILIDGKVVSMPNIQSKITSQGVITGEFNSSEVRDMVEALRRGMKPQGKNTLE